MPGIVGREAELGSLADLLDRAEAGHASLVVVGEPGMGKSLLWQTGVAEAERRGLQTLTASGIAAEASYSFAVLSDLLAGTLDWTLGALAPPRRAALEAGLLLAGPPAGAPDPRAIALAVLDVLAGAAEERPLVLAIDDAQWLDAASASVLGFAFRRLGRLRASVLLTVRPSEGDELVRALPAGARRTVDLAPLGLSDVHRLLAERLGLRLAPPELYRLHAASGGNPLFALELGRELVRAGVSLAPGRPPPLSRDLRVLLGERLARLPEPTRAALVTAAAAARPTVGLLAAAGAPVPGALEPAARAAVVEVDDRGAIRFAHPLLAAACYEGALPWQRRAAHRALVGAVDEPEERARHAALAADEPDESVARALDEAADHARSRGAAAAAAQLAELAAELTPPELPERLRLRLLRAADLHRLTGSRERAAAILERLLPDASGDLRADALLALARTRRHDLSRTIALCEEALGETDDDRRVAEILLFLSWIHVLRGDVHASLEVARAGLDRAERAGDSSLLARAIARVALAETWAIDITPGLLERGVALEQELGSGLEYPESPAMALARRLVYLNELDRARVLLHEEQRRAAARGDEGSRAHLLFYELVLEHQAGDWRRGLELAAAALELAEQLRDAQFHGMALYGKALMLAHLGEAAQARAALAEALAVAEAVGDAHFELWARSLLGFVALSLGDAHEAVRQLRHLPERLAAQGWNEPADPWPDTIEALVAVGEVDEARVLLRRFEALARRLGAPRGLATAARCRALLAAAEGDLDRAFGAFERALELHRRLEEPFEHGRTWLALGTTRRRARRKQDARVAFERALAIFERLGARLWAERARAELARLPGRRPARDVLTEAEARVAALAAEGLSNKEIAASLSMSVHTVEAHLTRTYRKLGVRSRRALAGHELLAARGETKV